MSFVIGGNSASTGYNLTRSLRFRRSASAYLNRTFTTPTSTTKGTYSLWVKRGALSVTQEMVGAGTSSYDQFQFLSSDVIRLALGAAVDGDISTAAVFRDPSSWYHIVLAIDTTQATAANRAIIYVNNVSQTITTATAITLNATPRLLGAVAHFIGCYAGSTTTNNFDGYLTEVNFVDGQQLTPSSFGSTNALTGVWQPARYTGSYGTNGFYLPFTDNSALTTASNVGLGKDFSGNANYWVTNNISITAGVTYDSMTDVPTLTSASAANFAVLNPIDASSNGTLSRANLQSTSVGVVSGKGSIAVSSGKWYWEVTCTGGDYSGVGSHIGIDSVITPCTSAASARIGSTATSYSYNSWNGQKQNNNSSSAYGNTYTTNDVVSIALDLDNGKIWWAKNGTWQASGDPAAGTNAAFSSITSGLYTAACGDDTGGGIVLNYNFGQRPFTYTPPTGFVALNTYNLPTSTIVKGNTVMDATLYTGTLLSNAITNAASFKPDLVWVKSRSAATDHKLTDSVRGVTKGLISDTTGAETTDTQGLTAFGSAGFTVGTDTNYNNLAATYVAWQWQAGQGSTSSNTNGTITSTVSVNASAGFSVVTYTGTGANATVGHGLGVAPSMVIAKSRTSGTAAWLVYHSSLGNGQALYLAATSSAASSGLFWNNTTPTSTVFSIGTSSDINVNTQNYVAYCWTPIAGFSAFGSYTGNGSTDGPFVYTGFKPKFVMIKRTDVADAWLILDTARLGYNGGNVALLPNSTSAEGSSSYIDILSNGFKVRLTSAEINASGGTYIYMAFAENPFKNSLAR